MPAPARRKCSSITPNAAMTKEQWSRIVESITTFVTASAELMQNLKDVVDHTVPVKIRAEIIGETDEEDSDVPPDCYCTTTKKAKLKMVEEFQDQSDGDLEEIYNDEDNIEEIGDQPDTEEVQDEPKADEDENQPDFQQIQDESKADEDANQPNIEQVQDESKAAEDQNQPEKVPNEVEQAPDEPKVEESTEEPKVEGVNEESPIEDTTDTDDTDTEFKTAPGSDANNEPDSEENGTPEESKTLVASEFSDSISTSRQNPEDGELITIQGSHLDDESDFATLVDTTEDLLGIAAGQDIPTDIESKQFSNIEENVSGLPEQEEGNKINDEEPKTEEVEEQREIEPGEENQAEQEPEPQEKVPDENEELNENKPGEENQEETPEVPAEDEPPPAVEPTESEGRICTPCASATSSKTKKVVITCADEIASEEQLLNLAKLKQNLKVAQNNLRNIEDQVREMEKLMKDYNTVNSPEGKINPAVLYREIMKPQTVPYFRMNKMQQLRLSKNSINSNNPESKTVIIGPSYTATTAIIRNVPCPRNKRKTESQERVSVLSVTPLPSQSSR